jgi:hypothetical protein
MFRDHGLSANGVHINNIAVTLVISQVSLNATALLTVSRDSIWEMNSWFSLSAEKAGSAVRE